ncbi:MAG: HNH endonuclease [Candidatus Viridilinea halotolerans]|uniref:HNH endonuclease n=1 Tax=Candidatus Viridilinea halotolerans TaxID=2491704 RepID=A0A426TZ55_9CHLR|nr:MAG: HNH endonuclease [Candidatus Viridilinea halotolerans]
MKARDFIQDGECVIVVFTTGHKLEINKDHSGFTGNWPIDPHNKIDRVIIYYRNELAGKNNVFLATFEEAVLSDDKERYELRLSHIQYAGETVLNWYEFADTGPNPIRYLP